MSLAAAQEQLLCHKYLCTTQKQLQKSRASAEHQTLLDFYVKSQKLAVSLAKHNKSI
jgi:hypothetical protein